jgi:TP901 family phage tail tape measure protein
VASESSVLVRLRLLGGQAFAREAKTASSGLGTLGTKGRVAERGIGGVNKALGVGAVALRGIGVAAGVAAAGGLAYGVRAGVKFEQSMANVQARLLTSKSNMALLSNQALDLGAKTQFSAQQSADAMNEFAAAGFNTQQIMKMMPGTLNLAAASGEDLATTAELQGAMMRQFGLRAGDAGHVADLLTTAVNKSAIGMDDLGLTMKYVGPVAGRFNQKIEDVGAAAAILGNVGIKGETAGTTLRRAFVNLVKPSGKTMDTLNSMGITTGEFAKATVNAKGDLRAMPEILGNLAGHFEDLTKPQQRKALAQLFGVEALPGMLTLFGKGEGAIRRMSGQLQNSGGAAQRTAGIMRNTVAGAWDNFTGSIETAAIRLTKNLNPAMKDALNLGSGFVNQGTDVVSDFIGGASGAASKRPPARRALGQAGNRDVGAPKSNKAAGFGQQVRGVVGQVGNTLKQLAPIALDAGKQLLDAFKPALPFFQNVLLPLLKGVAAGVLGGVVMAFRIAVPIIKILATVLGFVGKVLAPLKPVFFGIGVVIGTIAGGPILGLLGKLRYLGVVFRILAVPIRVASGLFRAILRAVVGVGAGFLRALTSVQRFAGTFTSLPGRVIRAALNVVGGIVHAIGSLPGKLVSIAGRAASRLVSGLSSGVRSRLGSLVSFMGRVGKSMLDAVVNAIKAAPGALLEAIKAILPGGKVGGAIADFLGIATGGTIRRSGWAVVGERGPELARFGRGDTVYDSKQTSRARAAMASAPRETFVAHLHLDSAQVHTAVFRRDQRLQEAT